MMTWKAIITVVKKVVVLFWADDAGDVGNGSGDSAFPPWNCYMVVNFKMPAMIMLKLTIISKCWMLLSVISRIIKTEVWVICWGWRLTQITQTRGACILGRLWIQNWIADIGLSCQLHLPLSNYWMRWSMIWLIINAEIWVICRSQRLRLITLIRGLIIHDNMRKPDSIIVLQYIFKQSAEENTTQVRGLETRKTLNTKLVLW